MKTIKSIFWGALVIGLPFLFTTCDVVDKFTTIEIPLKNFPIDIPFTSTSSVAVSSDPNLKSLKAEFPDLYSFGGEYMLNLNDPGFANLQEYKNSPITLVLTDVKLKITPKNDEGTTVKDFTSSSKIGENTLSTYKKEGFIDMKTEYTDQALTNYLKKAFASVQDGKSVNIDISGYSDILPSEIEGVEIGLVSIVCSITAQISLTK
jgi:hypothetical protein